MPTGEPDFTHRIRAPETDKRIDELIRKQSQLDKKFWTIAIISGVGLLVAILSLLLTVLRP